MNLEAKIKTRLDNVKNHSWGLLDLRNCGLTEIPKEIFDYINLINIDLSNDSYCDEQSKNKITIIPDEIVSLKKLSKLNLANNQSRPVP